ncbi:MAG: hypothetical protein KF794_10495 [Xanthobacteraceae bacterium]|nr:hypothetical protein [Xanthobacteraceae bacterium]QYK44213.1 MAG: hypothetical protein KF794_10495 [Xanthobacteraceae bacterium]
MAQAETTGGVNVRYVEWGPIIAGAFAAAAISFLLLTFGSAIGLSLASPWPNSGASATTIGVVVAIWSVIVQVSGFAGGGYLAGRMRSRWVESPSEGDFRDGAHGFLVWAVGIVFGAGLLALGGISAIQTGVQSAAVIGAGATAGATNAATRQFNTADYATDFLLRPAANQTPVTTTPATPQQQTDLRPEINRILSLGIRDQSISARDRTYLAQVVAQRTGLPEADAQKRVDETIAEAQRLEVQAREAADKARKAAILAAFLTAASLLASIIAAVAAASLGGKHRDQNVYPHFMGRRFWSLKHRGERNGLESRRR